MATRRSRFARLAASSLPRACIGLTKEDHVIEKLEVQRNPVNTTTFGPWKFGRINGIGSNYGAKCF